MTTAQNVQRVDKHHRPDKIPQHLREKRNELVWSLAQQQDYTAEDIRQIFNFAHVSSTWRIIKKMPQAWKSPWVKKQI